MALRKQFIRKLDDLWRRRTTNIRSWVTSNRGRPREISKAFRENSINELQELATQILLPSIARRKFRQVALFNKINRVNSRESKHKNRLLDWAKSIGKSPIIYSYWRGKKCLYVGKALNFASRFRSYTATESGYLRSGNIIKVSAIKSRGLLGQAECLAIHLFQPIANRNKAAHKAWGKSCEVCEFHDLIREELQSLFRMR